ncbi:MAG: hypothetical protein VXY27_03255, partial [Thermoproteota archaeon]|nr:hypothetical protein [Thermoproteota archaeon]
IEVTLGGIKSVLRWISRQENALFDGQKNEIFSKLKMIGFSEVEINPNGYVSGSLNVILEN